MYAWWALIRLLKHALSFFFSKTILSFMLYHQTLLPVIQFMDKEKEIIIQYFFLERFSPYLEFHNKSLFLAQ